MSVESKIQTTNFKSSASGALLQLFFRKVAAPDVESIENQIQNLDQLLQSCQGLAFLPDCQSELVRQRMLGSSTLKLSRLRLSPEKDQAIVENWLKANEQMASWAAAEVEPSLEKILHLHGLLEAGRVASAWRDQPMFISDFENYGTALEKRTACPAFEDVPALMDFFMDYYSSYKDQLHPLIFAASIYQWLVSIHPFNNGNGRTARLVLDWVLALNGYPPVSFTKYEQTYAFISPAIAENFSAGHETSVVINGVRNTASILFGLR